MSTPNSMMDALVPLTANEQRMLDHMKAGGRWNHTPRLTDRGRRMLVRRLARKCRVRRSCGLYEVMTDAEVNSAMLTQATDDMRLYEHGMAQYPEGSVQRSNLAKAIRDLEVLCVSLIECDVPATPGSKLDTPLLDALALAPGSALDLWRRLTKANVPCPSAATIYSALKSLVRRDLALVTPGVPRVYSAVS